MVLYRSKYGQCNERCMKKRILKNVHYENIKHYIKGEGSFNKNNGNLWRMVRHN